MEQQLAEAIFPLIALFGFGAFTLVGLRMFFTYRSKRLELTARAPSSELEGLVRDLREEVQALRADVGDLHERVDFAERLLTKAGNDQRAARNVQRAAPLPTRGIPPMQRHPLPPTTHVARCTPYAVRKALPGRLLMRAPILPLLAVLSGCAKYVWAPPPLDLQPLTPVGLVEFSIENAQGTLHKMATQRFAETALAGQEGIEILELGAADAVLAAVGEPELGPRAAQRIGTEYEVPAVFVGHLVVSDVKPRGVLPPFGGPHVEATVSVELTVRLLSTRTGGTLWSRSARATETVGEIGLVGGRPYFGAEDPNEAYGRLVEHLVEVVTGDLRPRRVRA